MVGRARSASGGALHGLLGLREIGKGLALEFVAGSFATGGSFALSGVVRLRLMARVVGELGGSALVASRVTRRSRIGRSGRACREEGWAAWSFLGATRGPLLGGKLLILW